MKIISSPSEMNALTRAYRKNGATIGLVPTMGALHQGHVSLLATSAARADVTVLSIFVNPTQFGPAEDYGRYPRAFEADRGKAAAAGCTVIFAPEVDGMYPPGHRTIVEVEELGARLCGVSRPTHFRGVATVVLKLINIVAPDFAFFGQKDAQQVIILKRMTTDLQVPVTIEICATVREADGLAMSSRNAYLSPQERRAAPAIYRGLQAALDRYDHGERNSAPLREAVVSCVRAEPLMQPEYIDIVDTQSLHYLAMVSSTALIAVACRTAESGTRLIDNIVIGGSL